MNVARPEHVCWCIVSIYAKTKSKPIYNKFLFNTDSSSNFYIFVSGKLICRDALGTKHQLGKHYKFNVGKFWDYLFEIIGCSQSTKTYWSNTKFGNLENRNLKQLLIVPFQIREKPQNRYKKFKKSSVTTSGKSGKIWNYSQKFSFQEGGRREHRLGFIHFAKYAT